MDEERIDIDPLFIGMTRPPTIMGVPIEFLGINFILFGIGVIAFLSITGKLLFIVCINLPLHALAYLATEKDPHWIRVSLTKLNKCAPNRNKKFWKSNSYKA